MTTDQILSKAGLGYVLVKDGLTADVEEALRRTGEIVNGNGVDPVTRLAVKSRTIDILKHGKIQGASELVKAALSPPKKAETNGKSIVPTEPEPWPDPVNGSELLDEITGWISGYVFTAGESVDAITLWAVSTWFVESIYFAPLLSILSPTKQAGKTLIIDLLEWICRKPVRTSGVGITPAVIFRLNEDSQPTFLVDEAEKLAGKNSDEGIIGLLNEGYRRGGKVHRCGDKSNQFKVEEFDAFGFRLLASIKPLWDTILDRSIVIRMTRKPRNQNIRRFKAQEVQAEGSILAQKILRFVNDNTKDLQALLAETPQPKSLSDRGCDNWSPLFAVAQLAGDDWLKRALSSAKALNNAAEDEDRAEKLIHDIHRIFKKEKCPEAIKSGDLKERLDELESSPWGDYGGGKGISTNKLAALLRPFEVRPRQGWTQNGNNTRGYWLKDLIKLFEVYIPPSELLEVLEPNIDRGFSDSQGVREDEPPNTSKTPENLANTGFLTPLTVPEGDTEEKKENTPEQHIEGDL